MKTKWHVVLYDDFNGKCFDEVITPDAPGTIGGMVDKLIEKYVLNSLSKMIVEYAGYED